ncbi:UNVERIFIED_CONTAM: hypothetical protein HHA_462030 [Hammondia hammondi]|eukprot:XP_008883997.1 hypothetical protein HHA_462030 [Hammondia hammondi]
MLRQEHRRFSRFLSLPPYGQANPPAGSNAESGTGAPRLPEHMPASPFTRNTQSCSAGSSVSKVLLRTPASIGDLFTATGEECWCPRSSAGPQSPSHLVQVVPPARSLPVSAGRNPSFVERNETFGYARGMPLETTLLPNTQIHRAPTPHAAAGPSTEASGDLSKAPRQLSEICYHTRIQGLPSGKSVQSSLCQPRDSYPPPRVVTLVRREGFTGELTIPQTFPHPPSPFPEDVRATSSPSIYDGLWQRCRNHVGIDLHLGRRKAVSEEARKPPASCLGSEHTSSFPISHISPTQAPRSRFFSQSPCASTRQAQPSALCAHQNSTAGHGGAGFPLSSTSATVSKNPSAPRPDHPREAVLLPPLTESRGIYPSGQGATVSRFRKHAQTLPCLERANGCSPTRRDMQEPRGSNAFHLRGGPDEDLPSQARSIMCTAAAKAAADKAKAAAAAAAEVAVATAEGASRSRRLSPRRHGGDRTNRLVGESHKDTETGSQAHPAPLGERARTKTDDLGSGKNTVPSPRYLSSNIEVESAEARRLRIHEKCRSAEEESFSLQAKAVTSEGSSEGKTPCRAAKGVKKKSNTLSEEKFTTRGREAGLLCSAALSASSSTAQRPGVSRGGSLDSEKRRKSETSQVLLPCGSSRVLMEKGIGGGEDRPGNDVRNREERGNCRLSWRACTDFHSCELSPTRLDGKSDAESRSRSAGVTLSLSDCRAPFSQSKRAERKKKFREARIRMLKRSYDISRDLSQEEFGDHSSSDGTDGRHGKVKVLGGQGVLQNFEASVESPLCQARSGEGDESESGRSERCLLLRTREERRRKQVTRESRDRIESRRRESSPSSSFHSNETKEKEEDEERLQQTQRSRSTTEPWKGRRADEKHQRCLSLSPPLRQSGSSDVDRSCGVRLSCERDRSKDTKKMETNTLSYTSSERDERRVSHRTQTPETTSGEGEKAAEEKHILPEKRTQLSFSPRASQAEASSPSREGGPRDRRRFEPTQRGRSDQQPRLWRHQMEMQVRETDTRLDIGGEEKHTNSPSKWLLSSPEFPTSSSSARSLSSQRNRHTPRSTETKRSVSVPRSSSSSSASVSYSSSSSPSPYSSASLSSSSLSSLAVPGAWPSSSFSSRLSAFSVWSSLIESGSRSEGCDGSQEPRERQGEEAMSERGDTRHPARQDAACRSPFVLTPGFQAPDAASPQPCSPTFGLREEKLSLEAFENGQTTNETVASMASVSLSEAPPLSSFASITADFRAHALPATTDAPVSGSVPYETMPLFFPDNRVPSCLHIACWPSTTHSTSCLSSSSRVPSSSSVASSSSLSSSASLGPSVSECRPALALRLDLRGDSSKRQQASTGADPSPLAFFSPTLLSPSSVHKEVAPPLTASAESAAVHLERVQLSPGSAPASTVSSQMREKGGEAVGPAAACMPTQGCRRSSSPSARSSSFASLLSPEEVSEFFARELRQMCRQPRFSFSPTRSTDSVASPAAPTRSSSLSLTSASCSSSSSSSIGSFSCPELMSSREPVSAVSSAPAGDVRGGNTERRGGETKGDEGKGDSCEALANRSAIREGQEDSPAASGAENLSWRSSLDSPLSSPSSSLLDFFSDLEIDRDEEASDEQRRTSTSDEARCTNTRSQASDPTRGFRASSPRRCSCQESDKIKRKLLGESEKRGASQGMLVTPRGEFVPCSVNVKTGDERENGVSRRSNVRECRAQISGAAEIQPRPVSGEANRESWGGGEELKERDEGAGDDPEEAKASSGRTTPDTNLRRERRNTRETHAQSRVARHASDPGAGGREETRINGKKDDGESGDERLCGF